MCVAYATRVDDRRAHTVHCIHRSTAAQRQVSRMHTNSLDEFEFCMCVYSHYTEHDVGGANALAASTSRVAGMRTSSFMLMYSLSLLCGDVCVCAVDG